VAVLADMDRGKGGSEFPQSLYRGHLFPDRPAVGFQGG
jgi:hypothetical protein